MTIQYLGTALRADDRAPPPPVSQQVAAEIDKLLWHGAATAGCPTAS